MVCGASDRGVLGQVEEVQAELALGFDSLVVGGSLDPTLLVPRLLPLLRPSSPLVIYSATPQPLMELEQLLIQACLPRPLIPPFLVRAPETSASRVADMSCCAGHEVKQTGMSVVAETCADPLRT